MSAWRDRLRRLTSRAWDSAVLTSWGSQVTRALRLVVLLPIVLSRLEVGEIAVWLLFQTLLSYVVLIDFGLTATFSRAIAYAMGGAESVGDLRHAPEPGSEDRPSEKLLRKICSTQQVVYRRFSLVILAPMGLIGTLALVRPIAALAASEDAWIAWGAVLVGLAARLRDNQYVGYLTGANRIALLARWQTLVEAGSVLTCVAVLLAGGGLLELVVAEQLWVVLGLLRNRQLCRQVEGGLFARCVAGPFDRSIFDSLWQRVWRSGLGVVFSFGLPQASGLIYAQVASSAESAAFLLNWRLIQMIGMFSMPPFYTLLPRLARQRARGLVPEQVRLARRGMAWSLATFAAGFALTGLLGAELLRLAGSKASFDGGWLWWLIGLSFLTERFGAMHLQLYSTTNHIIWHRVSFGYGIGFAVVSLALLPALGAFAFPAGMLAGLLGFYVPMTLRRSYATFDLSLRRFDAVVLAGPLAVMLAYAGYLALGG